MAIDIDRESPILLADFARLPEINKDRDTVRNWYEIGLLNRDTGQRVYLETIRIPTGRATSMEAYKRFLEKLNEEVE